MVLGGGSVSALADTDDPTPAKGAHYPQNSAAYYDKSTSSYYHSVWSDARDAWNSYGAFTWSEDSDPNCLTFTSSVSSDEGEWAGITGMTWNNETVDANGNQTGAYIYLNCYNLKANGYSQQERTVVAEHEFGHAMGLAHNQLHSQSVMDPQARDVSIQPCDVDGINVIYNGEAALARANSINSRLLEMPKPIISIDYGKDYSGNEGLDSIKTDAQVIVEGTVTG